MRQFKASRDIKINGAPSLEGTGFDLRSEGLARLGLPELEMLHVPEEQARNAASVINSIADYVANESRVDDGQRVAVLAADGALVARLMSGPKIETEGFLKKLFKKTTHVQRIVESIDTVEYPKVLLSTIALWRARALILNDDISAARSELLSSVEWFPGDPTKRSELFMGFPYNWENHLSYAALAEISDRNEKHDWLVKAFDRSEEYELSCVGDSSEELQVLASSAIVACARAIDLENASTQQHQTAVSEGVTMILSPVRVRRALDTRVVAERHLTIVPTMFAQYQATSVAQEQRYDLVAELITGYAGSSARLALLVEDTRLIYEGDAEEAPSVDHREYEPGDRIVSLILADMARRVYAGLSFDEIRVAYGLADDASAEQSGTSKMMNLAAREGEAYMQAVGG